MTRKTATASVTPAPLVERVEWHIEDRPVAYDRALSFMEAKVRAIRDKSHNESVWLIEHPPVYTAGTSAKMADLLKPRFPVFNTGRGGQFTYHGPGQRVAYVMLDLQKREPDLRKYVWQLEEWVIRALKEFGVTGERREGRVGIWVVTAVNDGKKVTMVEKKIAAIGVRVHKWVSFHGVAINVKPDLGHYDGIVPCGISDYGVTSLHDLGVTVSMADVDAALKRNWEAVFGPFDRSKTAKK